MNIHMRISYCPKKMRFALIAWLILKQESMLSAMFSGRFQPASATYDAVNGRKVYFIDRDGT